MVRIVPPLVHVVVVGVLLGLAAPVAVAGTETRRAMRSQVQYRSWTSATDFDAGRASGLRDVRGGLRLGTPSGSTKVAARPGHRRLRYVYGTWTSPWTRPGFGLSELVASWNADTPGTSWVQVDVRGRTSSGRRSSWDTLALWSALDGYFTRRTLGAQDDDLATVAVDTWRPHRGLSAYQLRVRLVRRAGSPDRPVLRSVGAVASRLASTVPTTSRPGVAGGIDLPVPRFSQMIHRGEYPRWGGGGRAWCSPTATSMLMAYYEALPSPDEYAWVRDSFADPWVDHAARHTFDATYDGTGNWPFNTAYAGGYVADAFVTRLTSLREAERLVAHGIPLAASVAFGSGQLDGAPIGSTDGHLVVIRGFTSAGDVVVNDPAAPRDRSVRRVYDRGQLERAWLRGSGGLVYVVHPRSHPLPPSSGHW